MGQGVREECTPEEVRNVVVPAHGCFLLIEDRVAVDPVRTYRKLALRNFCRKSSPSILITRHISCRRDRMRSPMRSPRVSERVAARAAEIAPFAPAAA